VVNNITLCWYIFCCLHVKHQHIETYTIGTCMKKQKIRIYFGCSLTHASKEFIRDNNRLKKILRKKVEVFEFAGLTPPVGEVYQHDTNMVRRCDVVVANISHPSLGLGMEMGIAIENKKPLITLIDDSCKTTRFLILGYVDPFHFSLRYTSIAQAGRFVLEKLHYLFPEAV